MATRRYEQLCWALAVIVATTTLIAAIGRVYDSPDLRYRRIRLGMMIDDVRAVFRSPGTCVEDAVCSWPLGADFMLFVRVDENARVIDRERVPQNCHSSICRTPRHDPVERGIIVWYGSPWEVEKDYPVSVGMTDIK